MAAQVIIKLIADPSGLVPGIESLEQLGQVDKGTADSFKASNKAFQDRTKTVNDTVSATEKLANSTKKLSDSIVGGAISQSTKQIQDFVKSAKAGELQFNALSTSIGLTKKRLQELNPATQVYKDLEKELKASIIVNENLSKSFSSSRAEIRAMRETLLQLEDAGLEGTKNFQNLSIEAGKLQDAAGDVAARVKVLASDTFKFDAAIQAIQGVAGGFALAQGAAALFGEENEEVQKALLKVNGAMAVLQGLQQIQNLLQAESAAVIATSLALQRISVLQTNLQAAAESRFIVVRVAATAAQSALNAVMAANPATVLLVAIGALAAGLLYLTSRTDGEAKAQEELNRRLELTNQGLRNQVEIVDSLADADNRQLALLKARGLEGTKLAQAEAQAIITQIARNARLIEELRGRSGVEDEFNDALARDVDLRSQLRIKEAETTTQRIEEGKESSQKAMEAAKKETDDFLRDQVAANEIALAEARDAFRRFEAEVQVIDAKLRQTLANTNLGQNERVLAEINAGKEIIAARQKTLGELDKLETINTASFKKNLNEQVLASAQAAAERLKADQAAAKDRADAERIEEENRQKLINQAKIDLAIGLASALAEISRNANAAELEDLQNKLDQGLISQKQYDQQVRILKRKQAQQDKQLALFQATIDGAAAVVKAFRDGGPVLAALVGALVLAQVAAIASRPIPAFKKGTKNAPAGPALVGEAGAELVYSKGRMQIADKPMILDLNRGDKVIPAFDTARIMSSWNIPVPQISQNFHSSNKPQEIDYDRIGNAVGKQLKKLPINISNWDAKGYNEHQIRLQQLNSFTQNRYRRPG